MKWNSQDPREVHVDDRGEIVIDVIEDGHHRLVGAWVWVLDWDQWTIDLEREINGILVMVVYESLRHRTFLKFKINERPESLDMVDEPVEE